MSCRKWEVQILRWHDGTLDDVAEARLVQHIGTCLRCRSLAEKSPDLDSLFLESQEPSLPPFLKERIVATVSEAIQEDSRRGVVSRFFNLLVSLRPAVAGALLVLGIGLGVVTGWNLAQSVSRGDTSYDLLSLAGFGSDGSGSSLEFIWTDSNGRTGQ